MHMITVVNKRVVGDRKISDGYVYVGRPTPLGNPYTHVADCATLAKHIVASRELAVEAFELNWDRLMEKPEAKRMFDGLVAKYQAEGQLYLVCWCWPQKCHADIIRVKILEACYD